MPKDNSPPSSSSETQLRMAEMADSDRATLRKWKIFSQWSDEELATVHSVNIYGNEQNKLGALVLTTEDEAFQVGHPLFSSKKGEKAKGQELNDLGQKEKTKVNALNGPGEKKVDLDELPIKGQKKKLDDHSATVCWPQEENRPLQIIEADELPVKGQIKKVDSGQPAKQKKKTQNDEIMIFEGPKRKMSNGELPKSDQKKSTDLDELTSSEQKTKVENNELVNGQKKTEVDDLPTSSQSKKISIDELPGFGQNRTKVDELTGLGLKKVEIGDAFCVALSNCGQLYFWGEQRTEEIPPSAFVYYELVNPKWESSTCISCNQNYSGVFEFAGVQFLLECRCQSSIFGPSFSVLTADEAAGKRTKKLVKFEDAALRCTKCRQRCTAHRIGGYNVNYCKSCHYLPHDATHYEPFDGTSSPKLMDLGESKVLDVACGQEFFAAFTNKNDVLLWGVIGGMVYKGLAYNPDNAKVKALTCGGNHVAVVSVQGELFTCGLGNHGQLGYEWKPEMGHETLRKVTLKGKVLQVGCGLSSTLCLMDDGSLVCFGSHMKLLRPDVLALNQSADDFVPKPSKIMLSKPITNIVSSHFTNVYFAGTGSFIFTWGRESNQSRQPELVLGGNLMAAMADLPATFTFKAPCTLQCSLSPHPDSSLYGKSFLSDFTLKLSDGDFPAHRLILHTNSTAFRAIFELNDSTTVMDMTTHNPTAFKSFLRYFYQVPPNDLNVEDLFDLYMLSKDFKEMSIARDVFTKLEARLNADTVLPLLRKAKTVQCSEFLEVCNAFVQSPEFKHIVAEKVTQDLNKTLSLLEGFNN